MCIYIDKIKIGINMHNFSLICNRVMTFDLCLNFIHNFVSPEYIENKWIEFDQILYMH